MRTGSLVSSAMFTESSKPTIAKNASDVAAVIATNVLRSSPLSKTTTREKSWSPPWVKAHSPTKITSSRPLISMIVKPTLSLTLSLTPPRRLIAASTAMNVSAMAATPSLPPQSRSKPLIMLDANACEAVDADVIPEHITTNATRKVKN